MPGITPSGTKETCSYEAYILVGGDREETSKCKASKYGEESVYPTSLAPHERLTDLAVVPREKPHTGAAAREQPRDSPVIER